ncbi:MAG TPA: MFS transporter [Sporichthya sp.]|nr:MFS transporter [Sporichthya sp.]
MTDPQTSPQTAGLEAGAPERQHYRVTLAVLVLSAMAYALQQTMVAPALPAIQDDLGVSTTAVTYLLTGFLLSASVCTPILGRLGDMFGKKRMLVATLVVFGFGSLISAVSSSIGPLITGRVIQGAAGAIFPLAFGIIRDEFPREKVAGGIGLISATIGIGGASGVVLSGVIVDHFAYEWVFWIGLAFTALTVVMTALFVPESPVSVPAKVDWVGAALLSAGMVALLIGVSEGNSWGWLDNRTIGLFTAAALLAVFWIAFEQRHPSPLVDMAMMAHRPVLTTNLAAVLIGFGMYSSFILLPKFVQTPPDAGYGFGSSVTGAGLFLLPNAGAMLIAGPMTGYLDRRFGSRFALILGTVLVALSFVSLAFAHSEQWMVYTASGVSGLGIGFAFSSMPNLIIAAVEPTKTGVATGMNAIMRTVGGAIGGQVCAAILTGYVVASGFPEEAGYTLTFLVLAGALGLALVSVLAIPTRAATRRAASALDLAPEFRAAAVAEAVPAPLPAAAPAAAPVAAARRHHNRTLLALILAAISYALQQTLIAPALPEIQSELHTSTTTVTYTLTAFLLAGSVATPIFGRLGDMFGKKRMLVVTMAIFGIGSLICALSTTIEVLIAGRAVQGIASAVFPLAFGIVRDELPRERVAQGIGLLSATFGIGGGTGIVLSGVIVDHLSYRWLFWLGLVVIASAAVAVALVVPESPIRVPAKVDWTGAALLSGGLIGVLLAVSEGNAWGWSDARILGLFSAGLALLAVWVVFESRHPEPLVAMAMMRRRPVFAANVAGVLMGFGMFASFILTPQYVLAAAPVGFGASVTQSGLYMLPSSVLMLVSAPITGWACGRFGAKRPLLFGAIVSAGGFGFLTVEHDHEWSIYLAMALLGIGIGGALAAMANVIIEAVEPTETGVATGMNTIMRTVGGAIGGQLAAAVLTAHLSATGDLTDTGFTAAFATITVSLVVAVFFVLAIPARPRPAVVPGWAPEAVVALTPGIEPHPPAGTLSGSVRRSGSRVPAAVLTVIGVDGREVLHTRADAAGEFTVRVPPGRYFVVATEAGRTPQAVSVELNGHPVTLDLALPPAPVPTRFTVPARQSEIV